MCLFGWLVGLRGQTGQTENLSAKDYILWNTKCSDCLPTRKSVVLSGFEETNSCGVHFFSDIWITLPPKAPVIRLILGDPCPFWRPIPLPQATEKGYCLRFLGGAVSLSWSAQSSGFLGGGVYNRLSLKIQAIWSVFTICAIKMLGRGLLFCLVDLSRSVERTRDCKGLLPYVTHPQGWVKIFQQRHSYVTQTRIWL